MRFSNRQEAGLLLAKALDAYINKDCVIYALPRGGVVLGAEIAKHLHTSLNLIISRKIGHPRWEDYPVGAVTEDGHFVCNKEELTRLNPAWLKQSITHERAEARRQRLIYRADHQSIPATNKIAIIVDDDLATSLALVAAIQAIRDHQPAQIVAATPIAPGNVSRQLKEYADEVITLETTENYLGSISAYYDTFSPVYDDDVIALLQHHQSKTKGAV